MASAARRLLQPTCPSRRAMLQSFRPAGSKSSAQRCCMLQRHTPMAARYSSGAYPSRTLCWRFSSNRLCRLMRTGHTLVQAPHRLLA